MLVCTAFHPGDFGQAMAQARWIHELNGAKGHNLLLIRDTRCTAESTEQLRSEYAKSYDLVEVLDVVDNYSRWPDSCNQVFGLAARHIMRAKPQPWLFLEPDAVPLKTGWLDALWAEYQAAGKPFMGDFVSAATAGINVVDHMSGNAIWPADLFTHAGLTLIADVAFDVAGASQIVPQMHKTKLIQHQWKAPPFESWAQVEERIRPEAVVYHANKTGELITLLREHRMMDLDAHKTVDDGPMANIVQNADEHASHRAAGSGALASQETGGNSIVCDIFIKTYPPDYPWLKYCALSLEKFARFGKRIIIAPTGAGLPPVPMGFENPAYKTQFADEYGPDGYLSQQVFKLYADTLTDADFILFTDSDTIFTRAVTPETYFTDGKVNWMITPYAKTDTPWQPMIEKFLGRPVEFETMRRHPQCVPRWLLIAMRKFCEKQHGMPLDKYVMSQPYREFSEFNALGAFAFYFHHDKFNWINTEEVPAEQWPPLTVLQKYSHDGLTPEIEAEFEAILSPASEFVSPAPKGTAEPTATHSLTLAGVESGTTGTFTLPDLSDSVSGTLELAWNEVPWADKESSLAEIGRLSARLREFCTGAGRTRQVRDVLRENGVIK